MKKPNPKPGPVQLPLGIEPYRVPAPTDGPTRMPDSRKWRSLRTLFRDVQGGPVRGDTLAVRWVGGWRMVERWRHEGMSALVCVLENGSSIYIDSAQAVVATGEKWAETREH